MMIERRIFYTPTTPTLQCRKDWWKKLTQLVQHHRGPVGRKPHLQSIPTANTTNPVSKSGARSRRFLIEGHLCYDEAAAVEAARRKTLWDSAGVCMHPVSPVSPFQRLVQNCWIFRCLFVGVVCLVVSFCLCAPLWNPVKAAAVEPLGFDPWEPATSFGEPVLLCVGFHFMPIYYGIFVALNNVGALSCTGWTSTRWFWSLVSVLLFSFLFRGHSFSEVSAGGWETIRFNKLKGRCSCGQHGSHFRVHGTFDRGHLRQFLHFVRWSFWPHSSTL